MIILGSSDTGALNYLKLLNNFKEKKLTYLLNKKKIKKLSALKKDIKLVITGSAQGNSLDKKLINFAKSRKIFSISVIEHWTNYKSRFFFKNKSYFPDLIFVNDSIAYEEAIKEGLPKKKLKVMGNVYFEKLAKKKINNRLSKWAKNIKKKYKRVIIFISEQIKSDNYIKKEYGSDEFETIKKIKKIINVDDLLIIKCHPGERVEKFFQFKDKNTIVKKKITYPDLINMPSKIIGIKSNLILELSLFRNDIISYRPSKDKTFVGERLKVTKLVRNKLNYFINLKNINNRNTFKKYFIGSSKKIENFIKKRF